VSGKGSVDDRPEPVDKHRAPAAGIDASEKGNTMPKHPSLNRKREGISFPLATLQDSVGNVRAVPRAKAQRRKGPGRRWYLPTESYRSGVCAFPARLQAKFAAG
jgi:hypothetical protein